MTPMIPQSHTMPDALPHPNKGLQKQQATQSPFPHLLLLGFPSLGRSPLTSTLSSYLPSSAYSPLGTRLGVCSPASPQNGLGAFTVRGD